MTNPPRTRDGKAYPGGKSLRRTLKNLASRKNNSPNKTGYTLPGSMKS